MDELDRYTSNLDLQRFDQYMLNSEHGQTIYNLDELPSADVIFSGDVWYVWLFHKNPETGIGHWTLFIKFDEYNYEYFDSLAGPVPDEIILCLAQTARPYNIAYLREPMQGSTTTTCGKQCILRLNTMPRSLKEYDAFFKKLKSSGLSVDEIVNFFVKIPFE